MGTELDLSVWYYLSNCGVQRWRRWRGGSREGCGVWFECCKVVMCAVLQCSNGGGADFSPPDTFFFGVSFSIVLFRIHSITLFICLSIQPSICMWTMCAWQCCIVSFTSAVFNPSSLSLISEYPGFIPMDVVLLLFIVLSCVLYYEQYTDFIHAVAVCDAISLLSVLLLIKSGN